MLKIMVFSLFCSMSLYAFDARDLLPLDNELLRCDLDTLNGINQIDREVLVIIKVPNGTYKAITRGVNGSYEYVKSEFKVTFYDSHSVLLKANYFSWSSPSTESGEILLHNDGNGKLHFASSGFTFKNESNGTLKACKLRSK